MARTASMTKEDAEQVLGPRGNIGVTADNRLTVRKWLNAQGFPSLFSGGLSMKELQHAYNDLSGRGLEALRRKLDEAGAIEGEEELPRDATTQERLSIAEAIANTGSTKDSAKASQGDFGAIGGVKSATVTAGNASEARKPSQNDGQPPATPSAGVAPDMQRVIAAVMAAMAAMGPQGTDEETVKRIAQDVVRNNRDLTTEQIKALVAEEAPKHVTTTRIEVKLPESDQWNEIAGQHHPMFATLLKAAASRQIDGHHPLIWLSGPAGSGKTYAAKMLAKAMGAEFHYNGALSMPHELLGFIDAGGSYHETPFRKGYTAKAVYLFDEVDGSDNSALLALNAALANGRASFPNGQAERHQDSIIVATANTWGLGATADYVGRTKIDAAFLSRFPVRLPWDYDTETEKTICGDAKWAERVQRARAKARTAGIKVLIDPRASIAGAGLIKAGFTSDEAAKLTYLANLTDEQKRMVEAG